MTSDAFSRLNALHQRAERWVRRLRPYTWLWPPLAFLAGALSFFLVDRQQTLGAVLALGLLVAWVLLLSENLIGRLLSRRGYSILPGGVTAFIAQMIHQETLFFTLPFILATTVWSSGQALFTLLMIGCALLSILDPLYFRLAERHRWLYFAFHAQCVFLVVLVTLPIMLQLTTGESFLLAVLAAVFFSLPSLVHLLRPKGILRWLAMIGLTLVLAVVAWSGRAWVPPATLWLTGSALSPGFDAAAREPRGEIALTEQALKDNGLYAYTAIRAPRGLREKIYHEWRREGELIDRIPLIIHGGRDKGYRAWTHKQHFPEQSQGDWRIDVMTSTGQRIGVVRFRVGEKPGDVKQADGTIRAPGGLPGLDVSRLVPGL
ncbi:Protein of unknown function [Modicisalibacter ilicicola DSM 19980]|uniref:DUF2914 domain-containing protein n=1 Tax=Modicisalibacter ilicicola DSM 19980 TaxID=1121942 RepID=A0A1M4WZ28_9GAMM|nr:DUF5924 family protein [Halomonas ilicicola]SHE86313.1 Protein of unknown function [Halomonas ilicicola DSM 19980]